MIVDVVHVDVRVAGGRAAAAAGADAGEIHILRIAAVEREAIFGPDLHARHNFGFGADADGSANQRVVPAPTRRGGVGETASRLSSHNS